jgi:hypothetical protein
VVKERLQDGFGGLEKLRLDEELRSVGGERFDLYVGVRELVGDLVLDATEEAPEDGVSL